MGKKTITLNPAEARLVSSCIKIAFSVGGIRDCDAAVALNKIRERADAISPKEEKGKPPLKNSPGLSRKSEGNLPL